MRGLKDTFQVVIAKLRFLEVLKRFRIFRTVHYVGFTIGGYVIALNMGNFGFSITYLILLSIIAFLGFHAALYLNDIFDLEIDRVTGKETLLTAGILHKRSAIILSGIFSISALLLSYAINLRVFWLVLAILLFSSIYSVPIIRIKRIFPLNIVSLAIIALLAMITGFSVLLPIRYFPSRMAILVLITLSLTFGTKDMRDIKGDREKGIRTLFTLLGDKRGKRVNSLLILIGYLTAPLILARPSLYWLALPCGIATSLIALRERPREDFIFLIYIFFGLYILYLIASKRLNFGCG